MTTISECKIKDKATVGSRGRNEIAVCCDYSTNPV